MEMCIALYFHVRILFFHLSGLSSHSMWCRQPGNRKMEAKKRKETKHRREARKEARQLMIFDEASHTIG